jgi:2'-5' RNA ligase
VPPENFHVTLAFLGSVAESSVAKVEAVGDQVAAEVERASVQVTLDAIEYWRKAKVVCATARLPRSAGAGLGDTLAGTLATALQSRLTAAGFTPDLKSLGSVGPGMTGGFRPHVTLVRKVLHRIAAMDIDRVVWSFAEFALVESRTEPEGAVYRVLESFPWVGTSR